MTYPSWQPRHRLTTVPPGKLDLFVLTLVDGVRAAVDPVTEYDAALVRAQTFHRNTPCQIKVLPVTGPELRNLLGIATPDRPQPVDAAVCQLAVDTLIRVVSESSDPDARADALAMLTAMGVVTV